MGLPAWFDGFVLAALLIGFPVVAIVAWAFELTPEGVKRTAEVDPEGHVLATGGEGEEYLNQVLDLNRVDTVREHGTYGMIRVWQELLGSPPPPMPAYQQGFAAGEIMKGLGPLAFRPRARVGSD